MNQNRTSERGAALLIAMLLVVVLGVLTTQMTGTANRAAGDTTLARGRTEARVAAEGGIETARLRLWADPGWSGETLTIGRSTVVVTASKSAAGHHEVTATATCPVRGSGLPVQAKVVVELGVDASGSTLLSYRN